MIERRKDERRTRMRRKADRDLLRESLERRKDEPEDDGRLRKLRRAIRHNCMADLDYEVAEKRGESEDWDVSKYKIKGRILDLSSEGAALFTKQPLSMGQVTTMRINLYDGRKIETVAEVRWTKRKEKKGGYATGVQFTQISLDDEKAIQEFLDELDETLGL